MKHSTKIISLVIALFVSASAFAQVTVKLRLVASKTSEPVPFATVSLTEKGADSAAKYVLSDSEG